MNHLCIMCGIVLGLFISSGCNKEGQASQANSATPAAAPVTVVQAALRDVPVELRSIASVEPFSTVIVRSRVSGQLQKVHVTAGQDVKKDDLLFEIDPRPFEIMLHQAEARHQRDEALAKNAQVDFDRTAGLLSQHAATQEEADKARYTAEAAQATVRADEAAIEDSRLQLQYSKILSPLDGRAGSLMSDLGNVIKADDTQLLTINQVGPIYVTFNVPEQDLAQVRKYMQADKPPAVDVIIPPETQVSETGKLSFIDNRVDNETGTIRLKATYENADRQLWPGQFVQAILKLTVVPNQVVIPTRAIQSSQQGPFVFVATPGMTAEQRPVKVGRALGDDSVIDSGLSAGEQVVTDGQLGLRPNANLTIKPPTTAPTTAKAS